MAAMSDDTSTPARIPRATWHTRVSALVFTWMAAALVVVLLRDHLKDSTWLMVHFLLLGAVTNALFIWSWHFAGAILRVPQADRADEIMRLALLNLGIVAVAIGVPTDSPAIVSVGAVFVAAAVGLHARAILRELKRSLPSPYSFTADAYLAASGLLVAGIVIGALMELVDFSDATKARVVLAHVSFNLLGWVGIPILGTIVTLWPTMLRTRIAPNAAKLARRVLPVLVGATILIATAFALDIRWLAALGLVTYAGGFVVTLAPMLQVARGKRPSSFATLSAAVGMLWLIGVLMAFAWRVAASSSAEGVTSGAGGVVAAAAVGGVLQVLLGCLSYLLPAMAAGGPSIVRLRNDRAERLSGVRLALTNAGLVLGMLGAAPAARAVAVAMTGAGVVSTVAVLASTLRRPTVEAARAADARREPRG